MVSWVFSIRWSRPQGAKGINLEFMGMVDRRRRAGKISLREYTCEWLQERPDLPFEGGG